MLTGAQQKDKYNHLLISNFLYSPKIREIKHGSLSFVVLTAINESKEPRFEKIKEEFTKLTGIEINDENFFEETFAELRKNNLLFHEELKCTEKGIKYLENSSEEYNNLKKYIKHYFKIEFENFYFKKYNQKYDLDENVTNKLFDRFWNCLEHNAIFKIENIKNIFGLDFLKNEMSRECIKCYSKSENPFYDKELDGSQNKVMNVYYKFIYNLYNRKDIPKEIENIQKIYQYYYLVLNLLPHNNNIKTFFEEDFINKYFYLDTNVIISAIAFYDENNIYIDTFLKKLKKLNNGTLNIFWNEMTENELLNVFRSSKSLIKALECYSPFHIQHIISNVAVPNFVFDYFNGNWNSVESYGKKIKKRYLKLKRYSEETNKRLHNMSGYDESLRSFIEEEYSKSTNKIDLRLEHDVEMVAKLVNYRKQSSINNKNKLISDYWIVTFDESLIKFQESEKVKNKFQTFGVQPVCIGLSALKLLMEPYILTKSSEIKGEINSLKIKESILINLNKLHNFEDLFKFQENDLYHSQRLIGEYLETENINEFITKK